MDIFAFDHDFQLLFSVAKHFMFYVLQLDPGMRSVFLLIMRVCAAFSFPFCPPLRIYHHNTMYNYV